MVKLAVQGNEVFRVSDVEIRRKGVSYTVDSLKLLHRKNPRAELFLIIGSDNLSEFHTWKSYREITNMAKLVVYPRSQGRQKQSSRSIRSKVLFLKGILLDISSSDIRRIVRQKGSIRYLVPAHVEQYIRSRHLYCT